jgi:hypothetical protein
MKSEAVFFVSISRPPWRLRQIVAVATVIQRGSRAFMAKVTGLGGAFVRAADPKVLYAWYEEHLGVSSPYGSSFPKETQRAYIAVAFFPRASKYFPVAQPAMLNFQVHDLMECWRN